MAKHFLNNHIGRVAAYRLMSKAAKAITKFAQETMFFQTSFRHAFLYWVKKLLSSNVLKYPAKVRKYSTVFGLSILGDSLSSRVKPHSDNSSSIPLKYSIPTFSPLTDDKTGPILSNKQLKEFLCGSPGINLSTRSSSLQNALLYSNISISKFFPSNIIRKSKYIYKMSKKSQIQEEPKRIYREEIEIEVPKSPEEKAKDQAKFNELVLERYQLEATIERAKERIASMRYELRSAADAASKDTAEVEVEAIVKVYPQSMKKEYYVDGILHHTEDAMRWDLQADVDDLNYVEEEETA